MCFIYKKKIKELQESIKELTYLVKTPEVQRLRIEEKEFTQVKEFLQDVKIKVKSVKAFQDESTGLTNIRIIYEAPTIILKLDSEGTPNKNKFLYASNMLNMISIEDMQKIQNVLDQYKENKK